MVIFHLHVNFSEETVIAFTVGTTLKKKQERKKRAEAACRHPVEIGIIEKREECRAKLWYSQYYNRARSYQKNVYNRSVYADTFSYMKWEKVNMVLKDTYTRVYMYK